MIEYIAHRECYDSELPRRRRRSLWRITWGPQVFAGTPETIQRAKAHSSDHLVAGRTVQYLIEPTGRIVKFNLKSRIRHSLNSRDGEFDKLLRDATEASCARLASGNV